MFPYKPVARWFPRYVQPIADKYDLPLSLVLAICMQESLCLCFAWNTMGAFGLMQCRLAALTDYNRANKTNWTLDDLATQPLLAIEVGCWYFRWLLNREKGDTFMALRAYNVGFGYAESDERGGPDDGKGYANKVLAHQKELEKYL